MHLKIILTLKFVVTVHVKELENVLLILKLIVSFFVDEIKSHTKMGYEEPVGAYNLAGPVQF